jgi:hypothetical protein
MSAPPSEPGPPEDPRVEPLADLVTDASALLYHAVVSGQTIAPEIRDPIIKARAPLLHDQALSPDEESKFLSAYAQLAVLAAPVTAATLRATSRHHPSRSWVARVLRLRAVSEAQMASFLFGFLAICLLVTIGLFEGTRTFIAAVISSQDEVVKVREEMRAGKLALHALDEQIKALGTDPSQPAQSRGVVKSALSKQRDELDSRLDRLREQQLGLEQKIAKGYDTLGRIIPFVAWSELRNVIVPVANMIGGFFLPLMYGALGTCAYILRTIYAQMVSRSYDARRSGEFVVRIFLGMLSGITLQWLLVRDGSTVPGGLTPAVLAFLGGYSVELLFTAMDRLLAAVTGSMRATPPAKAPAGAASPDNPSPVGG